MAFRNKKIPFFFWSDNLQIMRRTPATPLYTSVIMGTSLVGMACTPEEEQVDRNSQSNMVTYEQMQERERIHQNLTGTAEPAEIQEKDSTYIKLLKQYDTIIRAPQKIQAAEEALQKETLSVEQQKEQQNIRTKEEIHLQKAQLSADALRKSFSLSFSEEEVKELQKLFAEHKEHFVREMLQAARASDDEMNNIEKYTIELDVVNEVGRINIEIGDFINGKSVLAFFQLHKQGILHRSTSIYNPLPHKEHVAPHEFEAELVRIFGTTSSQ